MKTTINLDHETIEAFFEILVSQKEDGINSSLEQIVKNLLLQERDRLSQKPVEIVCK